MITITDSIDVKRWGEFVYNHPYGNIFQTPEMAEVYKRTKNYEPITLAAIDSATNEILAMLLAVVIKEVHGVVGSGLLGSFSTRSTIHGGPLYMYDENGIDAVKVLIRYYNEISENKAVYGLIRNMWDTSKFSNIFNDAGYEYEEHINYLIDLNIPTNNLWGQLSKSRRNGINRGMRRGVTVDEIIDRDTILIIYKLLKETYRTAKVPFADISLLESIFDVLVPKNMVKFFIAKEGNTCIGTIILLTYKDIIFDWYAGAPREYSRLCPNDILAWHAIEWGLNNGYNTFDFGGAGKPNKEYGVREFKKQFGGKLVNFGRYTKIHSPMKLRAAKKMFELYKRLPQ